jgi:polyphosphate glucokinase
MRILVIDVGGTHVKVPATGHKQRVEFPSGPRMTPAKMVAAERHRRRLSKVAEPENKR